MSQHEQPVSLPAHLWEALDTMSAEMGVPRDGLVSQAVFAFARQNGYVVPGKVDAPAVQSTQAMKPVTSAAMPKASAAPPPAPTPNIPKPAPYKAPAAAPARARPPVPEPPPVEEEEDPIDELPPEEEENPFSEESDAPEASADEMEGEDEIPADEEQDDSGPRPKRGPFLVFTLAGREPFVMEGDSATIGRGKHCDFIIESNRVSREHARFTRESGDFVIEDLNSSNGTFFGSTKERVTRRKIKDGDEFTFGTEKVKFTIKK